MLLLAFRKHQGGILIRVTVQDPHCLPSLILIYFGSFSTFLAQKAFLALWLCQLPLAQHRHGFFLCRSKLSSLNEWPKLELNLLLESWCFLREGHLSQGSLSAGKLVPNKGVFGCPANMLFGVNKAFKDLCLLRLVLGHTLLGFFIVSVGLRHLAFFILANLVQRESPENTATQLVEKKINYL